MLISFACKQQFWVPAKGKGKDFIVFVPSVPAISLNFFPLLFLKAIIYNFVFLAVISSE